ncbi:MAG TPA: hypothetical protein VM511_01825 [Luteolibacter sp.]|jgi:hypothetical protein|nr:hypothetical protein [Luteolibacter sp.]
MGMRVRWFIYGLALCFPSAWAGQDGIPKITGVREWVFTDGSKQRARMNVWEGKVWIGGDGRAPLKKEIDRTIPEQRAIAEGLETGKIHIEHPPVAFSIKTPEGEIEVHTFPFDSNLVGKERTWTRTDGKTAAGTLLNMADDEISVRIGNTAWRLEVSSLSPEDRAYLDRMLRGQEPVYPLGVKCPVHGYGGDPGPLAISGEKFCAADKPSITFEKALDLAWEELGAKVDRRAWKLYAFQEHPFGVEEAQAKKMPGLPADRIRRGYQACFAIDESKVKSVQEKLGGRVTENGWYWVYLLDDGTSLTPPGKKK